MSASSKIVKSIPRVSVAALVLAFVGACNFILDFDADQCASDQDCTDLSAKDPAFTNSVCIDRVCVSQTASSVTGSSSTGGNTGCVSSEQCTADNAGQPYICRKVGDPCV